ncbi:hypothetical protein D3C75_987230 [compost metagenome]
MRATRTGLMMSSDACGSGQVARPQATSGNWVRASSGKKALPTWPLVQSTTCAVRTLPTAVRTRQDEPLRSQATTPELPCTRAPSRTAAATMPLVNRKGLTRPPSRQWMP